MQRSLQLIVGSAAVALLGYAVFVQFAPFTVTTGQDQDTTNLIRVQDFLAAPDARVVLTGSSLTFRLPQSVLGGGVANLALAGGGARTGLALIARSGAQPGLVLVESNLLLRPANDEIVNKELRFPDCLMRRLRAFRAGYDPVNLVWRGLRALLHRGDDEAPVPPDVTRQLTEFQRKEKSRKASSQQLSGAMADTRHWVDVLQARGIKIGFYEMPIDPSLTNSPFDTGLRGAVRQAFPPSRFCWLALSVPGGAYTVDGIHLASADAALVTSELVQQSSRCR